MRNSFIWPIDRTLSGATTLSHSGPGSDDSKGVLCILQSSNITGTSQSDCLASYAGHSLVGVLPLYGNAVRVFSSPSRLGPRTLVGVVTPASHPLVVGGLTLLQRCTRCILQSQPTRTQDTDWGVTAAMQSLYSTTPADWANMVLASFLNGVNLLG